MAFDIITDLIGLALLFVGCRIFVYMRRSVPAGKLPPRWPRFLVAVFVAFLASVITFALFTLSDCRWGPEFENALIGFIGVFCGSVCFIRPFRFLGSVVLLVMGVGFDLLLEDTDDKVYPLSVFWVALGGLVAVAFYYWRRPPNTALEPTAATPAVGGHPQIHACGFSRRGSALDR